MSGDYNLLLHKLDEFIRKYYKNQLIRGLLFFACTVLGLFILLAVAEWLGHFGTTVRTFLFYLFICTSLYIFTRYIFIPLAHLYRFGKIISYEQASAIIGRHFPAIEDKLLNTLQLKKQAELAGDQPLLLASINQRITELKPVPFVAAVNLKKNYRFARYAAIPVAIIVMLLVVSPSVITESSLRLLDHNTFYEKKAPFSFQVENSKLEAIQNEDLEIRVKLTGSEIPDEVYLTSGGNTFKMQKENTVVFSYTLRNLQKSLPFRFTADDYSSREYTVKVLPRPVISQFEVSLEYPAYTGKRNEKLNNSGDLTIPAGTRVRWEFGTRDVENLQLAFADTTLHAERRGEKLFSAGRRFIRSNQYSIRASNSQLDKGDSISYLVTVLPDLYPLVSAEEIPDSLSTQRFYYIGRIEDDYGFRRLEFRYRFVKSEDAAKVKRGFRAVPLSINPQSLQQSFYYQLDLKTLGMQTGDELEYFFEVWDNDGVTGSKSTRSATRVFKAPTEQQLDAKIDKNNNELKNKMQEAMSLSSRIEKDIQDIQKKMAEKKNLTWDDKKKVQDLLDKQKKLETLLDEIKKDNQRNNNEQQEYNQLSDPELMKKQEELQKLMEEVLDENMKKLMKELQEMMKENNKDLMKDQLDQMQLNEKEMKKDMDRALELFKQLELEKKMEDAKDKLDKMAEDEKKLGDQSMDKNTDKNELKEKQQDIREKFEELQKDLKEIEEKNQELEKPQELPDTKEEQEEIKKDLEDIEKDLDNKDQKKASQKQKKTAEKMEKLAQKMNEGMKGMENKQKAEDYNALRQILENLIEASFEQERLISAFRTTPSYNPQYVQLTQRQRKLKDDTRIIEDSLLALSKRQIMIKSFINKEIGAINANIDKSIASLGKRDTYDGMYRQQLAMTSMNNLAVMLSEILKNMQEDMNEQMGNSGQGKPSKKKGKDKKPSMAKMKELQEELNKQMQQFKDGKAPGGKEGKPNSMMFSKMAAQQEMIRREMQKLQEMMKKEGKDGKMGDMGKTQELMDKTERDLLNKKITPETIKRQQEILTRLLEHEKAEKEQENDNKRESNEGKELPRQIPPAIEEYLKQKQREQELLRTLPPDLNIYYRQRVKDYFRLRAQ